MRCQHISIQEVRNKENIRKVFALDIHFLQNQREFRFLLKLSRCSHQWYLESLHITHKEKNIKMKSIIYNVISHDNIISHNVICTAAAAAAAKSLQSCPTLCDPIDNSPPGSPVSGILQARVLEWGAIAVSTSCLKGYTSVIVKIVKEGYPSKTQEPKDQGKCTSVL